MLGLAVVRGGSMEPTLRAGQWLLVRRGVHARRPPRRGEVVLVQHPSRDLRAVKRVAAVPGETWEGATLDEDEFAVRGDNPRASTDSRAWGPLPRSAFRGRVVARLWPPGRVRSL